MKVPSLKLALVALLVFAAPVTAQDPVRIQIPVEALLDAVTVDNETAVTIDVRVDLVGADSLYRAGADAALAGLQAGGAGEPRRERHVLIRVLESRTFQNVAILGAGLIVANAIRKNRTDVDVDVDVEGDEHIIVVPPHEHDHGHGKKGRGKGHKPGG